MIKSIIITAIRKQTEQALQQTILFMTMPHPLW